MAQTATHVSTHNEPPNFADPADVVVFIVFPLLIIGLALFWKAKRRLNLKITDCGNHCVWNKELKHLASDRNIEKTRDVVHTRPVVYN